MADDVVHVSTPEDMEAFDTLPWQLKQFLNEAPTGIPALPVKELYEDKISAAYEVGEAVHEVKQALIQWLKNKGVRDLRPVVRRRK